MILILILVIFSQTISYNKGMTQEDVELLKYIYANYDVPENIYTILAEQAIKNPSLFIIEHIDSYEKFVYMYPTSEERYELIKNLFNSVPESVAITHVMRIYFDVEIDLSSNVDATNFIGYSPLAFTILVLILLIFLSSLVVWKNRENVIKFTLNRMLTKLFLYLVGLVMIINLIIINNLLGADFGKELVYFTVETNLVHNLICFFFILFLIFSFNYLKTHSSEISIEFPILFLISYIGMLILISSKDLFLLFIGIELTSFSYYTLAGYRSKRFFLQTEGSLKYFIIGSIASSLFIFGLSLVYINFGTVDFNNILTLMYFSEGETVAYFGVLLMLVAVSFKLGIAPFHLWLPEVYYASTSIITFFFLILPKFSLVYVLKLLCLINFDQGYVSYLFVIYFFTFLMGTLSASKQTSLDKFLAYSSVANNAWFILNLATGASESFLWFYLLVYSILVVLIYIPMSLVRKADGTRMFVNLRDLLVLKKTNPTLAVIFSMSVFSLAGIPPFLGFFSKFFLILSSIDGEYYSWTIIAIIFSVFSCYYYIRLLKIVYFSSSLKFSYQKPLSFTIAFLISILTAINLFFLFSPKTLILLFYFL